MSSSDHFPPSFIQSPGLSQRWCEDEFDRLDVNKDGVLDRDEFMQLQFPAVSPVPHSQDDPSLQTRLQKLLSYWEVPANTYHARSLGANRVDANVSLNQLRQAIAELESLSRPYGFGSPGATYAQRIPGEEVFRDVVRMKVARIEHQLAKFSG